MTADDLLQLGLDPFVVESCCPRYHHSYVDDFVDKATDKTPGKLGYKVWSRLENYMNKPEIKLCKRVVHLQDRLIEDRILTHYDVSAMIEILTVEGFKRFWKALQKVYKNEATFLLKRFCVGELRSHTLGFDWYATHQKKDHSCAYGVGAPSDPLLFIQSDHTKTIRVELGESGPVITFGALQRPIPLTFGILMSNCSPSVYQSFRAIFPRTCDNVVCSSICSCGEDRCASFITLFSLDTETHRAREENVPGWVRLDEVRTFHRWAKNKAQTANIDIQSRAYFHSHFDWRCLPLLEPSSESQIVHLLWVNKHLPQGALPTEVLAIIVLFYTMPYCYDIRRVQSLSENVNQDTKTVQFFENTCSLNPTLTVQQLKQIDPELIQKIEKEAVDGEPFQVEGGLWKIQCYGELYEMRVCKGCGYGRPDNHLQRITPEQGGLKDFAVDHSIPPEQPRFLCGMCTRMGVFEFPFA